MYKKDKKDNWKIVCDCNAKEPWTLDKTLKSKIFKGFPDDEKYNKTCKVCHNFHWYEEQQEEDNG